MSNFVALDDQPSVVGAWLKAVEALDARSKQAYNLVYTITEPNILPTADRAAIKAFNSFASILNVHTTETVANTIFPVDTYYAKGPQLFYDYYLDHIFPKVRKQWGTYFERMIVRRNDDGSAMTKDGIRLNPLARLIEKLDRRVKKTAKTTTHYELALDDPTFDLATFDPHHDGSYQVGGPCLSHLSFKVDSNGTLRLSAFYRSHWYIGRALGNLVGLARLQAFVASRVNIKPGPLTIVASEAILDVSSTKRSASNTRKMLDTCKAAWNPVLVEA